MALGQFNDPGFNSAPEWTLTGGSAIAGNYSLHGEGSNYGEIVDDDGLKVADGGTAKNANAVACDPDSELCIGFWASGTASASLAVSISHDDGTTWGKAGSFQGADGWSFYAVPFISKRDSFKVLLVATGGDFSVDDIAVGFTPPTFAMYQTVSQTHLGGAPAGFPNGQVLAGTKVRVPLDVDGNVKDPEAQRVLLTANFEEVS